MKIDRIEITIKRARHLKHVGRKDDLVNTIYVDNTAHAHVWAWERLATSHRFDISRAKKNLGYYPRISTQEGLARLKENLSRG